MRSIIVVQAIAGTCYGYESVLFYSDDTTLLWGWYQTHAHARTHARARTLKVVILM